MKMNKILILMIVVFASTGLFAQQNETVIKELKQVLKKSLYQSEITIRDDGTFNRKDNNGNTFVFNLNDVKEIKSANDGFTNVLIIMKEGKKSKGVVEGKTVETNMNVFAFRHNDDCKRAITLFKKLI